MLPPVTRRSARPRGAAAADVQLDAERLGDGVLGLDHLDERDGSCSPIATSA